jgi:hypothetical protein
MRVSKTPMGLETTVTTRIQTTSIPHGKQLSATHETQFNVRSSKFKERADGLGLLYQPWIPRILDEQDLLIRRSANTGMKRELFA